MQIKKRKNKIADSPKKLRQDRQTNLNHKKMDTLTKEQSLAFNPADIKVVKFRSPFDGEDYTFKNQKDWHGHRWSEFKINDEVFDKYGCSIGYIRQNGPFSVLINQTAITELV